MTPPAAQTLAAAFMTDPGFEWILPNVATRLRRLTAIWLSAFQGWIVGRRVQSGRPA
jgi:hypothetical protein